MHPYCCLRSIRRYLCKIFLAFLCFREGDFCHETDSIKVTDKEKVFIWWDLALGPWRASIGRFHASSKFKSYHEDNRKLSPKFFAF